MNVLFLFVSLSSLDSNSSMFVQLINEFRKNGHGVYVSAKGNNVQKTEMVTENGVPVVRIKSHEFTGVSSNVKKALAYIEYAIKQRYYTKKFFKEVKFDLIISHSLPPELGYIVSGLKGFFKCPFFLIQTDFIWQDAVAFGYFSKNHPVARYYKYWESVMFANADFIGCPTKGNISFIKQYYPQIDDSRLLFFPFWSNKISIEPDSDLRSRYGLDDKFVVVYGGSVGAAQRIEHIIELADACKSFSDISFVILGRGSYLNTIKEMASKKKLNNVIFKDYLPKEQYLSFLASCDVGMIILNEKMATPNFPSKSLSYLNMKVPILAALDHVTDFGTYLEENNAGLWGYSDDINTLKEKLLSYYQSKDLCKQVKENGYQLFMDVLQTKHAYQRIINVIEHERN